MFVPVNTVLVFQRIVTTSKIKVLNFSISKANYSWVQCHLGGCSFLMWFKYMSASKGEKGVPTAKSLTCVTVVLHNLFHLLCPTES